MSATVTISYPIDANFNEEYYITKHLPNVEKDFKQYGLKGWVGVKLEAPSPYGIQVTMFWDNIQQFTDAAKSKEGQKIMADISNFSDKPPVRSFGKSIGHNVANL